MHHLALAASNRERQSHLFAREEAQSIEHVEEPINHLERLVERYDEILRGPIVLFPKSSMAFADKGTISAALRDFDGGKYNPGDCSDAYVSFLHRHHHAIQDRQEDFEREAVELWGPIDAYLKKTK